MSQRNPIVGRFDALALFRAMDAQRIERGLSWRQVAAEMSAQSPGLDRTRRGHPLSPSTLTGVGVRRDTSCQPALFMLRWLDAAPEQFVVGGSPEVVATPLPACGLDRRLRWDLGATYDALDRERRKQGLTWAALALPLRCSPNQLTGIKTARYAIAMTLAIKVVQWLGRPAASFVYPAEW